MVNLSSVFTKHTLLAALFGAAFFYSAQQFLAEDQSQKIAALENKIQDLQVSLAQAQDDLARSNMTGLRQNEPMSLATSQSTDLSKSRSVNVKAGGIEQQPKREKSADEVLANAITVQNNLQTLKDLETQSVNDSRAFSEKVTDLLANKPTKETIAVVTKGIFDMAGNRESLPDYALQSIYHNQSDPDLKRVVAQVASLRGNNELMENQIAEVQTQLKSENPGDRQGALTNLAKLRNASAANAIAPLLQDPDINVKLDALLAMRATGNQTHINLVQKLLNDPDPAVSSLASDVISNLKNLSDSARTTLASADIAAELPSIDNP